MSVAPRFTLGKNALATVPATFLVWMKQAYSGGPFLTRDSPSELNNEKGGKAT